MVLQQRRDDCNNSRVQLDAPYTLRNLFNYSSHSTKCFLLSPLSSDSKTARTIGFIRSIDVAKAPVKNDKSFYTVSCYEILLLLFLFLLVPVPFAVFFLFFFFCFKKQRVQIFTLGA